MHKAGHPVDEAGITIYALWNGHGLALAEKALGAVENSAAMWTTEAENS